MTTGNDIAQSIVDMFVELEKDGGMPRKDILRGLIAYCHLLAMFESRGSITFDELSRVLADCKPQAFAKFVELTASIKGPGFGDFGDIESLLTIALDVLSKLPPGARPKSND